MPLPDLPWPLLQSVAALADAPLSQIAERLREATLPYMGSSALVIFTEDCTGRPQKKAGDEDIISRVSIAELDTLRATLTDEGPWFGEAELAGQTRPVLALKHASSNALLVLTDPPADPGRNAGLDLVTYLWRLTARRIREKVADAPPSYLLESRAASAERLRVTAELTDLHSTTLETLLAALRSSSLEDAAARTTVTDLTAKALIGLRTHSDRTTDLVKEPVAKAFERLREDLRPLTRYSGIEIEFIEPPLNGRALPGEVAHAARAIVRGLVLAMTEQPDVSRVRTQWDCDGENLLINVRDDGRGALKADAPSIAPPGPPGPGAHRNSCGSTLCRAGVRTSLSPSPWTCRATPGRGCRRLGSCRPGTRGAPAPCCRAPQPDHRLNAGHQREHGQVPRAEPVQEARRRLPHRGDRPGTQPRTPVTAEPAEQTHTQRPRLPLNSPESGAVVLSRQPAVAAASEADSSADSGSAMCGTNRTNIALKPGVLDSRATFSLWTRALASGKYAAAQPFAVG